MEGFIPMVYKSLKKNKTRRKYECLSSGAAQTYNTANFYTQEDDQDYVREKQHATSENDKVSGLSGGARHRRYNSVHVGSFGFEEDTATQKQLVRFRSHRMFSCVSGT